MAGDLVSDASAVLLLSLIGFAGFRDYARLVVPFAVILAGAIALLLHPRWLLRLVGAVYRVVDRWPRLFGRVRRGVRQFARFGSLRVYGLTTLMALAAWLAEAAAFYWVLRALGNPIPWAEAIFIFSFSMAVGVAVMLPAGFGGTEATMVGLLSTVGVGFDVALAATALIRVTTLWFAVALGCLAMPLAIQLASRKDDVAITR